MSALIPAELRSNPIVIAERTVREMYAAGRVTVGLAAVGSETSFVSVAGVSAVGGSRQPVAVALTKLTQSGGRIYGVPCSGVGPFQKIGVIVTAPASEPGGGYNLNLQAELARFSTTFASQYYLEDIIYSYESGADTGLFGAKYGISLRLSNKSVLKWQPAVAALRWVLSDLPWRGAIAAAARAGQWVRRRGWVNPNRAIRFESGAGTTRAVAVRETGAVVTTEDFSADEWLAEDWYIIDETSEPPPVDVTDWVFSGPAGAVAFAVQGSAVAGGAGSPLLPDGSNAQLSPDGSDDGFLYRRNGQLIAVPATDCEGNPWTPS